MARVTVEDCVEKVPNRFELVMMAARRARDIAAGSPLSVERDNDKNPVVALREIADEGVSLEHLRDALIKGHQRVQEQDQPEEEIADLMAGETNWAGLGVQDGEDAADLGEDEGEAAVDAADGDLPMVEEDGL